MSAQTPLPLRLHMSPSIGQFNTHITAATLVSSYALDLVCHAQHCFRKLALHSKCSGCDAWAVACCACSSQSGAAAGGLPRDLKATTARHVPCDPAAHTPRETGECSQPFCSAHMAIINTSWVWRTRNSAARHMRCCATCALPCGRRWRWRRAWRWAG